MKQTVLVVDDDTHLLKQMTDMLETEGYAVETAADGRSGLTLLRRDAPDVVILDLNMPEMGGIRFLRELGDGAARPQIIVSTARGNMGDFFEGQDIAAYLVKPYGPEVLIDVLSKCLAGSTGKRSRAGGVPSGSTVLLVEDDYALGARLERAIRAAGYMVMRARTGPDGLHAAGAAKPSAVVTKLILTGMNGDRLAELIRVTPGLSQTPVILYDDSGMVTNRDRYVSRPEIKAFVRGGEAEDIIQALSA